MIFIFNDCDKQVATVDLEGVSGAVMDIIHKEIEVVTYNTPTPIRVPFENQTDMFNEFLRLIVELEKYKDELTGKEQAFWATIENAGGTQH